MWLSQGRCEKKAFNTLLNVESKCSNLCFFEPNKYIWKKFVRNSSFLFINAETFTIETIYKNKWAQETLIKMNKALQSI